MKVIFLKYKNRFAGFIFYVLIQLCFSSPIFSQQNNILYFMPGIPEANYLNPAIQAPCRVNVGLPLISSFYLNYGNTAFSLNDAAPLSGDTARVISPENIIANMHNLDFISVETHFNYLFVGAWVKNMYFNFSIQDKIDVRVSLPSDVIAMGVFGNSNFVGETIKLNRVGANVNYYREYALGASYNWSDYLKIGAKAKLLFGKISVNSKKTKIGLTTDQYTHNLYLESDVRLNASFPLSHNGNLESIALPESVDIKQLLLNRKNPGFALDAGFIYQYDERFSYSASIIDLGFMRFRDNLLNVEEEGEIGFEGVDFNEILENQTFSLMIEDSLLNAFRIEGKTDKYFYFLPTKLYVGGQYHIFSKLSFGMLAKAEIFQYRITPSFTASLNSRLLRAFHTTVTYSYNNYTFNNIGFGFSLQSRNLQFYMISDNALGFFKPVQTRNINLRFGINLFFGCKKREKTDKEDCYWIKKNTRKKLLKEKLLNK